MDYIETHVGLGGLGVTCSPRDPRFAGKIPEYKSSGRDFKLGVPSQISDSLKSLKPEKIGL